MQRPARVRNAKVTAEQQVAAGRKITTRCATHRVASTDPSSALAFSLNLLDRALERRHKATQALE